MNERILQLAADAKIMTEDSINMKISFSTQLKAFSEKFAELILKDVDNLLALQQEKSIDEEWNIDESFGTVRVDIDDHFGKE